MSECLPFEPTAAEVAETRNAFDSLIPEHATLHSACSYTWLSMDSPVSLKETHYYQLVFTWPVNHQIESLSFYQNAACLKEEQKLVSCNPRPPSARLKNGELFTYSGNIVPTELKELLDHFHAFSVPEAPIVEVVKTGVGSSSDSEYENTIYKIIVAEDETEYAYRIEHDCRSNDRCIWRIAYVGKLVRV